jgi:hypothetical protein
MNPVVFNTGERQVESGPILCQRPLKEEPDDTDGDGGGGARVMLDVLEVKEDLAQLFLGDQVG